ncbi:MAG: response regulator [Deltaproteobacteria bacterium]|nr:response regulator [Deltaproteobacteria bacterium]
MDEPPLEHPDPDHARPPGQTFRILFLDNSENIEGLKASCKDAGHVVVGACTIEEAWAFLDGKDHVDVIVCAAHLDEESMFDFLRGVRESEVHRGAVFLILSLEANAVGARLERSTARAGMALGADGYLMMPVFDASRLVDEVSRLLPEVPMLQQSATEEEKRRSS